MSERHRIAGKLGGRPRLLTMEDIRQQQLHAQEIAKEGKDFPGNLRELKKLYLCRGSSGNHKQIGRGCVTTTIPARG